MLPLQSSVRPPADAVTRRRLGRRPIVLAATATLALSGIAACGSGGPYLNSAKLERAIAQSVLVQEHVYTRIACPNQIPQKQGHVFTCEALFDVGSYPIPVTEANGQGNVTWNTRTPIALLDISRVVFAIRHTVYIQRGVRSNVVCPRQVLQQKGITFTCAVAVSTGNARVKPGNYTFGVTELNNAGRVGFIGR